MRQEQGRRCAKMEGNNVAFNTLLKCKRTKTNKTHLVLRGDNNTQKS
jgi:hypothetical protein